MLRAITCAALLFYGSIVVPDAASAGTREEVARAYEAARPLASLRAAKRAGWRPFGGDEPLMGRHYAHKAAPDYVSGDAIDPSKPSNLIFSDVNGKQRLVALAFNVRLGPGEPLPRGFTGNADKWHVHDMQAAFAAATQDRPLLNWLIGGWLDRNMVQKDGRMRLAMVHLWLMPNPDGVFALHNRALAYLDLGVPAQWAEGASMAAARGAALATNDGCAEAVAGKMWVANVPRRDRRAMRGLCRQLAAQVRDGIPAGKEAFNARASAAWQRYDAAFQALLSPAQKARIAAMAEHGASAHGDGHDGAAHHGRGH